MIKHICEEEKQGISTWPFHFQAYMSKLYLPIVYKQSQSYIIRLVSPDCPPPLLSISHSPSRSLSLFLSICISASVSPHFAISHSLIVAPNPLFSLLSVGHIFSWMLIIIIIHNIFISHHFCYCLPHNLITLQTLCAFSSCSFRQQRPSKTFLN